MQLQKVIITMFFIAFLANAKVFQDFMFQREKPDSEKKQLIRSDFENVVSAVILSRAKQNNTKAAEQTSLPKPTFISSNYLSAKNRLFHTGEFGSSNVTTHEHTLVSLHCLLTL